MSKRKDNTSGDIETKYRDPLRRLKSTFPNEPQERFDLLRFVILRECRECERYLVGFPDGLDDAERWRREQNEGRREAQKQRNAIERLARFAMSHPLQVDVALAQAGFSGCAKEGERIRLAQSFARILRDYEKNLEKINWMPEVFEQSTHYYNLILLRALTRRPVNLRPSTGLMLRLVMVFRKFTAGETAFGGSQAGERIPTVGFPHYNLAGDFARVATGEDIADPETRLVAFIERNPDVAIYPWPQRRA